MAVAARVGAGDHAHARLERAVDGLDVVHVQRTRALADVPGARLAVIFIDGEGGHQEHAALRHHRDQLRLLVEIAAVLDGIDAGLEGDAQAPSTEGVAHDLAPQRMRLVDQGAHLVQVEGAVLRPVAGARAGAARGGALDDVGARPNHGAHDRPRLLDAIGDAVGQRGIGRHDALVTRRADAVTNAADGRHDGHGGEQPRPADQALLDGDPEPGVETARVSHGGVAHAEGALDGARGPQTAGAGRLVETPAVREVVAVEGEMVVTVDEARQHRAPGDVEDLGVRGPRAGARGDGFDAIVAQDDRRITHGRDARAVDQGATSQYSHGTSSAEEYSSTAASRAFATSGPDMRHTARAVTPTPGGIHGRPRPKHRSM